MKKKGNRYLNQPEEHLSEIRVAYFNILDTKKSKAMSHISEKKKNTNI